MSSHELSELLEKAVVGLAEHFESVQIVVTFETDNPDAESSKLAIGRGSFYTRFGALREQLINWEAAIDQHARDTLE